LHNYSFTFNFNPFQDGVVPQPTTDATTMMRVNGNAAAAATTAIDGQQQQQHPNAQQQPQMGMGHHVSRQYQHFSTLAPTAAAVDQW